MKKFCLIVFIIALISVLALSVGCEKKAEDVYGISISKSPDKIIYYAGESLDMSGCQILVRTHSGKDYTVNVTNSMVSGFDNRQGNHTMTITYSLEESIFTTTLQYTVEKALARSAVVTSQPTKSVYVDGESVDLAGLKAEVTFADGNVAERSAGAFTPTRSKVFMGDTEIIAKIDDVSISIPIMVVTKDISGVKVTKQPYNTSYVEGDVFDPSGIVLKFVYNNDDIGGEANYTVLTTSPLTCEDKTASLRVYYNDKEFIATVNITVSKREISSLTIKEVPKTCFLAESDIDLGELTATIVFENGTSFEAPNSDLSFYLNGALLPKGPLPIGEYNIEVYYKYATDSTVHDTLSITVTDQIVPVNIKVISEIESVDQYVGDGVSFRGLWLFAEFNDGSELQIVNGSEIAEGVTYTPEIVEADTREVVITYADLTYSFEINPIEY